MKKKTNIYTESEVLEKATYTGADRIEALDRKRRVKEDFLVNKIAELQEEQFNESRNLRAKIDEIWIEMKHIQEQIDEMKKRTVGKKPIDMDFFYGLAKILPEQDQEKLETEV